LPALSAGIGFALFAGIMDDDTIDELCVDEPIDTVPDHVALPELDVGDRTVVTSAIPPDPHDSPWRESHTVLNVVYYASGRA